MQKDERDTDKLKSLLEKGYPAGFITQIQATQLAPGLTEAIVREISAKKNEPEFLLEWRLSALRHWFTMKEPHWANIHYNPIDYQSISYFSAPQNYISAKSIDDISPELRKTYERLGIPLEEQKILSGIAVDAVFDSVSIATTFKEKLATLGIIFCSFSEAAIKYPELVKKYLGTVVPYQDNFFACLNAAVFTDGSFCFIPKGVRCPIELSTYFRINSPNTGQFERTLIIAEENSYVSYLEGCTAPIRDENQLHAAVVELIALENAQIKYATVQNWYPGDEHGKGGIYNFVTKRGLCKGNHSKISWTQIEMGASITWKYPSVILKGDNSNGEFYSIALTKAYQQADTGTKMIHVGKDSKSTIISKAISADHGQNSYRGLVKVLPGAENATNYTQCDSLLIGSSCGAHTFPHIESMNTSAHLAHEASTSKISDEQLFYCQSRGLNNEEAIALIVNGFCKSILQKLPFEFAAEAQRLLEISLEGCVG
ncbi:MAG: Fe-S cluster assembly protein SufB [Gammaproteobacteria bacterium]|jgi:Fe-S cluster assembly protein SufB|nr:Fe-S cluster assembly protein SufB [Gammaproteobacteria bacterium]